MPLGNGLMGGLLWGEQNTMRLSLDRGDLWDERPAGEKEWWKTRTFAKAAELIAKQDYATVNNWWDSPYNGVTPTKLPAGRLEITLDPAQTIQQFELNLATAEGITHLAGEQRVEALFSAAQPVALLRIPGPAPKAVELIPSGAKPQGGDTGPSSGGAVSQLGYPPAQHGSEGAAKWYVQEAADGLKYCACVASRRAGDATVLAVAVTSTNDASDVLSLARTALCGGARNRLRGDAHTARAVVGGILESVLGDAPGRGTGDCAAILSCAVLPRCGLATRCPADAAARSLDGRQRGSAAVERRLPQRPQHADDLHRLSRAPVISTRGCRISTTCGIAARCSRNLHRSSMAHLGSPVPA